MSLSMTNQSQGRTPPASRWKDAADLTISRGSSRNLESGLLWNHGCLLDKLILLILDS